MSLTFLIFILIVSIALYVVTKYYLIQNQYKKEKVEHFTQYANSTPTEKLKTKYDLTIKYLNANDARNLFQQSIQYLQNMNQANLAARKCQTLSDLYDKYMGGGLQDISEDEKSRVDEFMLNLLDMLSVRRPAFARYVSYWLRRISFAKGQIWLESGMPHTLGDTIIMDTNWFASPRETTLLHELTHIHQRDKFYDFEDLYFLLGYFYYPKLIKGMEPYYQLNRNNPDGSSPFWLWHYPDSKTDEGVASREDNTAVQVNSMVRGKIADDTNNSDYWWVGAVFKSAVPVDVTDVNYIAIRLNRGADGAYYLFQNNATPLTKFSQYNNYMGINDNNYHPNETTAKYMEWYLQDITTQSGYVNHAQYEGYKTFKKYIDEYLAIYFKT